MTKLVIVESPAKTSKIQGFLGAGWKVIASMGHIRGLEQSLDAIGLKGDFEPKYEFLKEKGKAIKQLKDAAKEAEEVYLAADDDREGEQIAYSVCLLLRLNPRTTKRIIFHEITKKAILHAVEHSKTIDMNKVNSQQARAMLDMMIGFTMSPLLWRYVGQGLSAGRCQTPSLALVVERENQIQNFKSQTSWQLHTQWSVGKLKEIPSQMEDDLEDEESAVNYMEMYYDTPNGQVIEKDIKDWTEKAPQPLITSTLQQQASAIYHVNPKTTMQSAQRLYEAGHITYMRSDKAVMCEEAKKEATNWVKTKYGSEYVSNIFLNATNATNATTATKQPKKKETTAQEAHECIRPTHFEVKELQGEWSSLDRKIYSLIWQRAVQSVMSSAKGETCKIKIQIDRDEDFKWISQFRRTLFPGWKIIGKVAQITDSLDDETEEDSQESQWAKVEKIQVGDKAQWTEMKAEPKETKAQGRYTEATLVRELEKHGIGRPSTFASLLATIQDKNYVEIKDIPAKEAHVKEYQIKARQWPATVKESKKKIGAEKSKLVPTDLGRSVLTFMLGHFNDLFDYTFTSQVEKRLDLIAEGTENWKNLLRDMWESYKERYETLSSKEALKTASSARTKEFSDGLKAVISKKGPLLLIEGKTKQETRFIGWPKGVDFQSITEEIAKEFVKKESEKTEKDSIGEYEGNEIIKKTGKFGDYLQCGDINIPFKANETLQSIIERIEAKKDKSASLKKFKEYEIRNGPYGPYIMKTSLKKAKFVSVPKDVDIGELTEKGVEALYKAGLEKKKKFIPK